MSSFLLADQKTTQEDQAYLISKIEIQINPIFDLKQNDGWLYSTANKLHIDTKVEVIERILPLKVGDEIKLSDLAEAERVLRRHRYLRDAKIEKKITSNGEIELNVMTWENWTLFPTVDLNRQGGETEYSYGVKDDNLLGLGLAADVGYFVEEDRSGYVLSLSSDAISDKHIRAEINLANYSDGERAKISINKPFYRLGDRHSWGLTVDSHLQEVSIDANELLVNRFDSDRQFAKVFFGYSTGKTETGIYRWIGGVTHDKNDFEQLPLTSLLPENRDLTYPWLAFEYQQDKFIKTRNLYLLQKTEDIQLGWYHNLKLGLNFEKSYREHALVWNFYTSYFGIWAENHWFRYGISGRGVHDNDDIKNAYYSTFYEHFYRVNDFRTWYLKAKYQVADNPYVDSPVSLGGETGLRGFPLEYQHGNKQWLVNLEKRIYPDINIAQLVDVGFVGFIDAGRNFGETPYVNQESGTLASVGLGVRFFLTRSSGKNVININFSKPINSDFVKDFDVSVIVRASF